MSAQSQKRTSQSITQRPCHRSFVWAPFHRDAGQTTSTRNPEVLSDDRYARLTHVNVGVARMAEIEVG